MKATIYSDGSFNPQSKKGSWAFTIVCDIYNISKNGKIPNTKIYSSIHYCEMYAVSKAVNIALKTPEITKIIVNTDSMTVYKFFNGYPPTCKDDLINLSQQVINLVKSKNVKLIVRHVKAHTKVNNSPSYMNRTVDRLAKKANL